MSRQKDKRQKDKKTKRQKDKKTKRQKAKKTKRICGICAYADYADAD